jgi:hypothetical protein
MFTDLDPSADPRLAAVFAAARAPAELPLPGEDVAVAAYRAQHRPGKSWFRAGNRPAQLIAASLFSTVVFAGSVAAAAAGALPLPIGGGHHHTTTSGSTDGADTTAADSGTEDQSTSTVDMTDSGGPGTAGHPSVQPTDLGSVAKGAATCAAASQGTCQAGRHGKAADAHSHRAASPSAPGGPAAAGHPTVQRPVVTPHGLRPDFVHPQGLQLLRSRVNG